MHHTLAWRASIADITAVDLTPVPDSILAINNAHFVPQVDHNLLYAYFGAAGTANRARFISPSLRQVSTPWIRPVNGAIVPLDEPNVADYTMNPLRIRGLEELQVEAFQTTGGAAVVVVVAGVTKGIRSAAPQGDIYTMRGTAATTAAAGAWTLSTVTWQDVLPVGRYAVVGLDSFGATMISARLIFEDQIERPGNVAQSLFSGNGHPMFRKGGLGTWGYFTANRMPNVEILCNAADTAQEYFLDLIRVG